MLITKFNYENKHYIVELDNTSLVFFTREYGFIKDIDSGLIRNDIKNPVALLRKICNLVRSFLYEHKIKFFTFYANSEKRIRIYKRFLDSLVGYSYYLVDGTFYVTKD